MNFREVTKQVRQLSAKGKRGAFIDIPTVAIPRNEPRLDPETGHFDYTELRLVKLSRMEGQSRYSWYWYNPYGCKSADIPIPPLIADTLFGVGEERPRWFVIEEKEHRAIRWLVERDAPCSNGLTSDTIRSLFQAYAAGGQVQGLADDFPGSSRPAPVA